jgi:hypothetical protein
VKATSSARLVSGQVRMAGQVSIAMLTRQRMVDRQGKQVVRGERLEEDGGKSESSSSAGRGFPTDSGFRNLVD